MEPRRRLPFWTILTAAAALGCSSRVVGIGDGDGGGSSTGSADDPGPGTPPTPPPMTTTTSTSDAPPMGTTTDVDTTGSDDDDDGSAFIIMSDAGPPPAPDCSVVDQDCPADMKCVWYVAPNSTLRRDAAKCIPVTGDVPPFAPCSLPDGIGPEISDDCDADSYCLDVYGTADHGFCAPFMAEGYDCDAFPGAHEAIENGSEFPAACLYYECQPLVPGTCPAGTTCTLYPAYLYGSMMCWQVPAEDELPLGTPCDYGQCGEGKLCAPADWLPSCGAERCCAEFCDVQSPSCSEAGTTCEFFPVWNYHDAPDFDWLGACVLPAAFD